MMQLDEEKKILYYDNRLIRLGLLSDIEFSILMLLVNIYPNSASRELIKETCWSGRVVADGSVNVAVNAIRTMLQHEGVSDLIVTTRGIGYSISNKITIFNEEEKTNENNSIAKNNEVNTPKTPIVEKKDSEYIKFKKLPLYIINLILFIIIMKIVLAYTEALSL